jgi:alpha-glucosidase
MGPEPATVNLPKEVTRGRVLLSSFCDRAGERVSGALRLRGNEGVIVEL